MFRVEMLPAGPGDCFWIEYGDEVAQPNTIIIDGGDRGGGKVLRARIDRACNERGVNRIDVELMIVTHIDNDHIVGIVELLGVKPKAPAKFADIWFNGRKHMDTLLGTNQGDALGQLLAKPGTKWNRAFSGKPITFSGVPVEKELPGGMKVTVLGPTLDRLEALAGSWATLEEYFPPVTDDHESLLGKDDGWPPKYEDLPNEDDSKANGSSIVVLLEYKGKRLLATGDAFATDLSAAIAAVAGADGKLAIDAFKVPHHGSASNYTDDLYQALRCKNFLVSSNGSRHGHPDNHTILGITEIISRPTLFFNCTSEYNENWGADPGGVEFKYSTKYPADDKEGLLVQLS
jgi:hypothetical protein